MTDESRNEPAIWKTRLRCALNKSLEFEEVAERAQLDISEPFKVYRLVPDSEQGLTGNGTLLHTLQSHPLTRALVCFTLLNTLWSPALGRWFVLHS